MNLITDQWIPVNCADGSERLIAPWEMADSNVVSPRWGRADFDIACYEFLIGLIFLACPPFDDNDRQDKKKMTPNELKIALEKYAPAFNLVGDGPLFMQEAQLTENNVGPGDIKNLDSLLLNGASENSIRNNNDIMVHRGQLNAISLNYAAMALYTLQNYAPAGGRGARASIRGGGPMTVLLQTRGGSLWESVLLNTPYGTPSSIDSLPWMRDEVITSEDGKLYDCPDESGFTAEVFFGMPRRIRLNVKHNVVVNFITRPYGINYGQWRHPLTPYYRKSAKENWLAAHPLSRGFDCRDFFGVILDKKIVNKKNNNNSKLSLIISELWQEKRGTEYGAINVVISGWVMSKANPCNFVKSVFNISRFGEEDRRWAAGIVASARLVGECLSSALVEVLDRGAVRAGVVDDFFARLKSEFVEVLRDFAEGDSVHDWLIYLRKDSLAVFDRYALPSLSQRSTKRIEKIVLERKQLINLTKGKGKQWDNIYSLLNIKEDYQWV